MKKLGIRSMVLFLSLATTQLAGLVRGNARQWRRAAPDDHERGDVPG